MLFFFSFNLNGSNGYLFCCVFSGIESESKLCGYCSSNLQCNTLQTGRAFLLSIKLNGKFLKLKIFSVVHCHKKAYAGINFELLVIYLHIRYVKRNGDMLLVAQEFPGCQLLSCFMGPILD